MEVRLMHTVNKYSNVLLSEFYLDNQMQIRRATNGYLGRHKVGDLANFFEGTNGYMRIQVPGQRTTLIRSHLVLLLSGVPVPNHKEVDHIDGDKKNDHPSNLRVVDRQRNSRNRAKRSDNTSGHTGIMWSDYHQHFVIRRTVNGIRYSRSRKTLPEAILVLEELTKLDGNYTTRHGK